MKVGKKALLMMAVAGITAAGFGVIPAVAKETAPPEMGATVPLEDLVIKFLAIPEYEPNRYTKSNGGKFAPEEMEKGLLIGAEMKYGEGNPEGMMAPLKHSFADITADLEFDTDTGKIVITFNDLTLEMRAGSHAAVLTKNGKKENLTIPSGLAPYFVTVEGETDEDGKPYVACYLPVKFTAEAMGANVSWDEDMHRLVMAFAFYYSDTAVEPEINSDSPYTTKKLEDNSITYEDIKAIADGSDDQKKKELLKAAVAVVNPRYQNEDGGWGKTNKEYDLLHDDFTKLIGHAYSTFDNGATHGHIKFLARILRAAKEEPNAFPTEQYGESLKAIEDGFWKAIDFMIVAQNEIGGWPQYYPYGVGYFKLVTYNDNAMTSIMELIYALTHDEGLMDSSLCDDFAWVREEMRDDEPNEYVDKYDVRPEELENMWEKALELTLSLQIEVDGQKTAWAQQYDPETGKPATGRGFELPSICTSESLSIVSVLMNIPNPSQEVVDAIEAYTAWTKAIGVTGFESIDVKDRTRELGKDRRYVYTGTENKTYGRFYGLDKTGDAYDSLKDEDLNGFYPIYSGRDSVAKLDHNVGGHERRSGYAFVQKDIEKKAAEKYDQWKAALAEYSQTHGDGAATAGR